MYYLISHPDPNLWRPTQDGIISDHDMRDGGSDNVYWPGVSELLFPPSLAGLTSILDTIGKSVHACEIEEEEKLV